MTMLNQRRTKKMIKSYNFQRINKVHILSFLFFAITLVSKGQNQDVVIIDAYKPTISDAFKINYNPKITDTVIPKPNINYTINPVLFPTSFNVNTINAAVMKGQPLTKLYKILVKGGIGNKVTTYGELFFNNLRSTSDEIGVHLNHFASTGKLKNCAFPGFSDNDIDVYANKFYRYHVLSGDVDYTRNVVHYYGFNPNDYPLFSGKKDSIMQRFNKITGQIKYYSDYIDSTRLNHSIAINYLNISDKYKAMENYVGVKGAIDKNVKFLGKTFEKQKLGLNADVNYYNDINKADTSGGAVIKLNPYFSAIVDVFKFNIGFNTFIGTNDSTKIHFYPNANFNVNIFNNIFIVYGGITNDLKRNNLIDLSSENPFINTSIHYNNTYTSSKVYGGLKGCISSYLSFNFSISKSNVNDMPLFVTDTASAMLNKFVLVYDKVGVLNTRAEITYQKAEKLKFILTSNFNQYSTINELQAWHKPTMDVKASVNYNLKDKIILKADLIAYNGSYSKLVDTKGTPEVTAVKLKGTVDFNLGLEYRYTKILSAFINFNNVAAVKYQQWYNYPNYGFTVLAGLTYAL